MFPFLLESVRGKQLEIRTLQFQQIDHGGTRLKTHLKMIGCVGLLCLCTACSSSFMRVGLGDEDSILNEATEEEVPVVAQEPIMPEFPPQASRLLEPPILPEDPPMPSALPEVPPLMLAEPELPPVFEFEPVPEPPMLAEPEPLMFAEPLFSEESLVAVSPEPDPVPVTPKFKELKDVYFDFDKANVRTDAVIYMESNADLMQSRFSQKVVLVEGHCDERGSFEYNLVLGARRAQSVKSYLIDLGIPDTRIRVVSYGEERPACLVSKEWCWQKNRRTHLVIQ
ncbi:MAG: OmpA family protein [Nitrospirota bacterium]|nr:OmpA family protein [Nitrospirota bacterium]